MEKDIAKVDDDQQNLKQVKVDLIITEDNKKSNNHLNYDTILEHIGQFGRYITFYFSKYNN